MPSGTLSGGTIFSFCYANNDPAGTGVWRRTSVTCSDTNTGITNDFPRNGNGSVRFVSAQNAGKADWSYERPRSAPFGKLSELTSLSYSWLRDASSTGLAGVHPVIRIIVDVDGDPTTTTDTQSLVFERAYNGGGVMPTGSWQTDTIGNTTKLWVTKPGTGGNENVFNWTLADFKNGNYTPTGTFKKITGNSLVLGITFGIGSGWGGKFLGAVDDVVLTMNGNVALSANFETSLFQASVQCSPTSLVDAASNDATCTVSLDRAAPVGGLAIALTPPAASARYSTTCGSSIPVAAGATTATCTISATPNTTPGDGDVTATLALTTPATGADYELGTLSSASVLIKDDDPYTVSLACAPGTLTDSAGQVSTCTITADAPAPAGGLAIALTPPVASPRYSTTCGSSITVAEGDTTAMCTVSATPNTTPGDGNATAALALATPAAGAHYVLGTPSSASVLIRDDDPYTVSLACTPGTLTDSAGQVSTCTITTDAPAPAGGLPIALTPPAASSRYSTTCTSPLVIAAGATAASCTVTATANTTPGDGDVTATLTLLAGAGYQLGPDVSATVTVTNDDGASIAPVPALGAWGLLLMGLGLAGVAWRRRPGA